MPASVPRIIQFPSRRPAANQAISKRPQPNRRRPWLRVVVLFCAALYLIWAGSQLFEQEMRMRQLQKTYAELLAAQSALEDANQQAMERIENLQNDPAFLEQLARQMGMIKSTDKVYLPVDSSR
ncbi:MAG: FtsB family cell division protein [Bacillota bacterium]|jgi:cell division protein FtsB